MNYLILRNDGIGDLIVSTCGIGQLRMIDKKAHITLICSDRNIEYAKILKKDGHIDGLYNLDDINSLSQTLKFISILRKICFEHIFILKSDWKNLTISLFCKSKNIHAINPTKISKMSNKTIYKYPLFLSNKIFKSTEIINSINIQGIDIKTKMGTHYRELFNKALNIKKTKLVYIKPNSVNDFESKVKKIFTPLKIKKQSTVLFHIDEKWSDINVSKNFIINLLEEITVNKKINLIVTNGKYKTGLNSEIWNFYKLKKINNKNNIYKSQKNKKIYFIKKSNIAELIGIASNTSLIFHIHGSLTHISSILQVPIVDVIRNQSSKYFYKWRPNFNEYTQIEIKNLKNPQKYIKKYL
jgi:ADP-heptose:LPS heptosyltransferase